MLPRRCQDVRVSAGSAAAGRMEVGPRRQLQAAADGDRLIGAVAARCDGDHPAAGRQATGQPGRTRREPPGKPEEARGSPGKPEGDR